MAWLLASLIAAFSTSTSDALAKGILRAHNEYVVAWVLQLIGLPIFWILFFLTPSRGPLPGFWSVAAISLILEAAATVLYMKALKASPLSLTLPFLSLTPLFLTVVPYLFLGETLSVSGMVGIFLIAAGSYVLHVTDFRKGLLHPFRGIIKEKGSLLMIGVAFLYSFTSTFVKKGVHLSSPFFFLAVYFSLLTVLLSPFALSKLDRKSNARLPRLFRTLVLPGLLTTVSIIATILALKWGPVAYAISVKRLSVLLAILYGHILFREVNIRERLAGTILMLAGFLVIVLGIS
jgi:drug/metabolite transporter (DMT)-like permease